jgi:glycosyl transferase family 87
MRMFTIHHRGAYIFIVCVWVIMLAGIFYLAANQVRDASIDFFSYYIGAAAIHQEKPIYAFETYESVVAAVGIRHAGLYLYPPTLAMIILPALLVSPYVASLIWLGLNIGLLLLGVGLLLWQSNIRDHWMRFALLLLPVVFTPTFMTLYLGQVNVLVFVLIALAYLAFVHRYLHISGVLLALSAWIKLWPIVLIAYFVWKREWKVVAGAIIGLLLIGLLTFAFVGAEQTTSFFTDRLPEIAQGTQPDLDHLNQSIPGIFAKMFAPSSKYVLPLVHSPTLAQQGSRITIFLLIVITIILCSWPIPLKDREQFSTEFTLVVIAAMLITGRLFESNLILLLPAYFFIAEQLQQEHITSWKWFVLPIASVVLINMHRVIWTLANPDKQALPWFLLIFPFVGMMVLWTIFAVKRVREIKTFKYG